MTFAPFFASSVPTRALAPGVALAGACAGLAAVAARSVPALAQSQMILAIGLGAAAGAFVRETPLFAPGLAFAQRTLLRLAVVLLGLQITAQQIAGLGIGGFLTVTLGLFCTLLFTVVLGRRLGVSSRLALLIGAGVSICGASAILAVKSAVPGRDEQATYAVACVTLFGTAAMILHPLVSAWLGLDARAYGFWVGSSIHEVGQAVAAAAQAGPEALEAGVAAKLARVALMVPAVMGIGAFAARRGLAGEGGTRPSAPTFLFGFLAMVAFASLVAAVPRDGGALSAAANAVEAQFGWARLAASILLAMAMAAMGAGARLGALAREGARPLALGALASLFIAGLTLGLSRAWL
jgi:uncharacterized integral membrane protein (TIGR00698 family)